MSEDAAKLLHIDQVELWKFLTYDTHPVADTLQHAAKQDAALNEGTKNAILIVSIILFSTAFLVCVITLTVWVLGRLKTNKHGFQEVADESVEQPCDEKTLAGIIKSSPSLPQIFDKPKLPLNIAARAPPNNSPHGGEELRQISVGKLNLRANFYTNRNILQVNVKEASLTNFSVSLCDNAFVYFVISIHSEEKTFEPAYFESELRAIDHEVYFDESPEFEVIYEDIALITLKIAIYVSDRFSQHRKVNEYGYSLSDDEETKDDGSKPAILPLTVTELWESEGQVLAEQEEKEGELLFSLCYMPTSGRLTFVALKGRNVREEREVPLGTYLRVSLMVCGKVMKTVQTTSVQQSCNPVYNEAFVFHTPLERIKDTDITVSVCSSEDLKNQQPKLLGKLVVGPASDTNLGRKHWEAMLSAPRRPVAQWHGIIQM